MSFCEPITNFSVGSRTIGTEASMFIVAEIGINHNGDMNLAHKTIEAAAESGADGVKFQNYVTEDFVKDRSLLYRYTSQGRDVEEPQYDMFKRCELHHDQLRSLKEYCDSIGLVFFSTPTSVKGIAELVELKAPLLKNGSDFLTHLPLVRAMARSGIPTVLSTGMATIGEIAASVEAFREEGGKDLLLLHCTSSYPTPPDDVHLRKILSLSAAFGCPVGLSDHTEGITAALGATVLGACLIEKHFTLDCTLPGPDHRFSSDPQEFATLVRSVRCLERQLGHSVIGPTRSESLGRTAFRISCAAARDLVAGEIITEKDIVFLRPGTGIPPAQAVWLINRKLKHSVMAQHVFSIDDIA